MKSDMEYFEMADSESPEDIIKASQRAVITAMQKVVADLKAESGTPGLTWVQLEYLLESFKKKEPKIIFQEREV